MIEEIATAELVARLRSESNEGSPVIELTPDDVAQIADHLEKLAQKIEALVGSISTQHQRIATREFEHKLDVARRTGAAREKLLYEIVDKLTWRAQDCEGRQPPVLAHHALLEVAVSILRGDK